MPAQSERQLKLGAFLPGPGQHVAAWRHPEAADGALDFAYYLRLAHTAERGRFDAFFLADFLSLSSRYAAGATSIGMGFEPVTLFAALAAVTEHIGFVATASTTYEDPYLLARRFASLDHLSRGRAAWNLVTTEAADAALNFSLERQPSHEARYLRAEEFHDVVTGLWDSWEDDALVRDRASGVYYRADKVRALNHRGPHYQVRGPLNLPRSPQGRPVVVQAGSSEAGCQLAARTAEVVFTAQQDLAGAQAFYRDLKGRMARFGRSPDQMKIMPGVQVYVGRSEAEAQDQYRELEELILPEVGLALLSGLTGGELDLAGYDLDGPLPELPPTQSNRSRQALVYQLARGRGLSIRGLYKWVAGARGHWTLIGTPGRIADELQAWFEQEAADGFNLMPPLLPRDLDAFVTLVIPELQRRGLFRTEYEGTTLRENLGLDRPAATSRASD